MVINAKNANIYFRKISLIFNKFACKIKLKKKKKSQLSLLSTVSAEKDTIYCPAIHQAKENYTSVNF